VEVEVEPQMIMLLMIEQVGAEEVEQELS